MANFLHFDCLSGISGNMVLGAFIDLGVKPGVLYESLRSLPLEPWEFKIKEVKRGSLRGVWCEVKIKEHSHSHRNLVDIETVIDNGLLPEDVIKNSKKVFSLLAEAEGKVHGKAPREVTFHEVGAVDSIVDIVGTCLAVSICEIDTITCSPILLGSGKTSSMHGEIPVPAPATVEVLRNISVRQTDSPFELTTPTGAALMAALAGRFGPMPDMVLGKVGYGAGNDRQGGIPNVLRVFSGVSHENSEPVWVLETNIDNSTAEDTGYLLEALIEAKALDVFLTPIQMKKSRLAQKLTVICKTDHRENLESLVFKHVPTLGIRSYPVSRRILDRKIVKINTKWGDVRIKEALVDGTKVSGQIEYDDLKKMSKKTGIGISRLRTLITAQYLSDPLF